MGDFAGVDPHRVRLLADRLKDLADTLDREAPTIRRLFESWHGTINQSHLSQQVTQVRTDARDMAKRADEALNLLNNPRFVDPNDPHRDWINIPWAVAEIDSSREAQQEVLHLKQAMDNPKDPASRAVIVEVAQSLADHQDDPAYLQAFMAGGGMDQAVRAARVLHGQDGTHGGVVLDKESEGVLAQFGQGVQAATSLAADGKITLPPDYLTKLTQPAKGDMWSVGMLFKYGPPGGQWDAHVLSEVGGAMLEWRGTREMRPDYSAPNMSTGGYGGYVQGKNAWYKSLGLDVDYIKVGPDDAATRIAGIDANDPSLVLMQRVSENANASRQLLTGPSGAKHAAILVSDTWHTPGPQSFDDAQFPAAVIRAATLDRQGHPKESAEAAANLVNAGGEEYKKEKGKSDYDRSQYPVDKEITRALSVVFQAYVPDFANSTGISQQPASASQDGRIVLDHQHAEDFLSMIMLNHDEAGNVVQAINAQISLTSQRGLGDADAQTYLKNLAELRGEVSEAGKQVDLDAAALTDAAHAKELLWFNIIASGAAAIPNPTSALTPNWIQAAIWAGIPYVGSKFSTGNAATVESGSKSIMFDDAASMHLPLMQGLVRSGEIAPPPGHPEWADGDITFSNERDRTEFNQWWVDTKRQQGGRLDNFDDDMRDGFKRGSEQ